MPESKSKGRSSRSRASPAKKTEPKKKRRTSSTTSKKSKEAASRATTTASTPAPSAVLIVDNGGDKLKYGWMTPNADAATTPQYLPNVTARLKHQLTILVGDQVEETAERNPSQMYAITRSTERGIVTHLGNQVQVWKRMLDLLGVVIPPPLLDHGEASKAFGWKVTHRRKQQPQQSQQQQTTQRIPAVSLAVLLLVPPHCPRLVLDQIMHVWMEDFGVSHVGFATSQMCATQPHAKFQTGCLVDVGWSATHVVPTFQNMPQQNAIRRMPLGGRHLVNIWKYYASYRQYNLMDQEWILRDVVRQLAYISLDFQKELQLAQSTLPGRRSFDRNFVLPDYQTTFRGQVELTDFAKYQLEQEEEKRKKKEQEENNAQQQQQEADDESEDDDEDFNDDQPAQEDDNAQKDEVKKMDEDENSPDGEDAEKDRQTSKKTKKKKKSRKKRRGKRKRDQEDDDDDDEEEEEDEDDNKQLLRQRLLRQQQEEERRRRELEAEQQVLSVSVERFTVPEVLFRPSDANLPVELAGLPHLILQSIKACPSFLQPALYRSIHITGGLSQLPNLQPRLEQELRTLIPNELEMKVTLSEHPVDGAWLGARDWIREKPYTQWSVSRDEWEASQKRKAWIKLLTVNGGALV
ncbi:Actin-66 (Fragment) [Seminavis robusta]|uniref:Actin-66 n=1 Tax=Seminavis robusta TaxID=568900 RepID=A0A9N8HJ48_9STRA